MKTYAKTNNVYELCDLLGLPKSEAVKIKIRLTLYRAIKKAIEKKDMTHAEAATLTGFGRTVITAIMNGNLDKITTDRLIDIASALGIKLSLKAA